MSVTMEDEIKAIYRPKMPPQMEEALRRGMSNEEWLAIAGINEELLGPADLEVEPEEQQCPTK